MRFSKFIDKTLEAAKQSALQMAGDDYAELRNGISQDNENNNEQAFSDGQHQKESEASTKQKSADSTQKGVVFERTESTGQDSENKRNSFDKKLESIRKYADQQTGGHSNNLDRKDSAVDANPTATNQNSSRGSTETVTEMYSRKDLQNDENTERQSSTADSTGKVSDASYANMNNNGISGNNQTELHDRLVEDLPSGVSRVSAESSETTQENNADTRIHKRLKRLESLMNMALSTPGHAFSTHPLFLKLLHKGVSERLVTKWFDKITQKNIYPDQQPELFNSKLLQIIKDLLEQSKAQGSSNILLFTGRSGVGKTHLVMKLAIQPGFLTDKELAIASLLPDDGRLGNRYSILKPFCDDHDIDFYCINTPSDIKRYDKQWSDYDHILVDTPGIKTSSSSLISCIQHLKKNLVQQSDLDTHYLVNTAVNGSAFDDQLAQAIGADHITLTHIDQSLKWGKTIQLAANTDYKLRFMSSGSSITGGLLPFVPKKFAKKLLRT